MQNIDALLASVVLFERDQRHDLSKRMQKDPEAFEEKLFDDFETMFRQSGILESPELLGMYKNMVEYVILQYNVSGEIKRYILSQFEPEILASGKFAKPGEVFAGDKLTRLIETQKVIEADIDKVRALPVYTEVEQEEDDRLTKQWEDTEAEIVRERAEMARVKARPARPQRGREESDTVSYKFLFVVLMLAFLYLWYNWEWVKQMLPGEHVTISDTTGTETGQTETEASREAEDAIRRELAKNQTIELETLTREHTADMTSLDLQRQNAVTQLAIAQANKDANALVLASQIAKATEATPPPPTWWRGMFRSPAAAVGASVQPEEDPQQPVYSESGETYWKDQIGVLSKSAESAGALFDQTMASMKAGFETARKQFAVPRGAKKHGYVDTNLGTLSPEAYKQAIKEGKIEGKDIVFMKGFLKEGYEHRWVIPGITPADFQRIIESNLRFVVDQEFVAQYLHTWLPAASFWFNYNMRKRETLSYKMLLFGFVTHAVPLITTANILLAASGFETYASLFYSTMGIGFFEMVAIKFGYLQTLMGIGPTGLALLTGIAAPVIISYMKKETRRPIRAAEEQVKVGSMTQRSAAQFSLGEIQSALFQTSGDPKAAAKLLSRML